MRLTSTPDYMTAAEVADHHRTVPGTVRYWRHVGYGPRRTTVGRKILYPIEETERFDVVLARQTTSVLAAILDFPLTRLSSACPPGKACLNNRIGPAGASR